MYYHGGKAGLSVGDILVPSPPHVQDDCPICVARAQGRVCSVGEYRAWLRQFGDRARPVLDQLRDVPDEAPMDPPSAKQAVYITTDRAYAQFYASRSGWGDLYRVEPIGPVAPSPEDHFPTWTCDRARVVAVLQRHVRLKRSERRLLMRRWKRADAAAERRENYSKIITRPAQETR